jgi:SMC interacting uncharacterized protein involved in chromosome segregation
MSNDMSMDEMIEVLARYRYNAKHDADRIKALESELSRLRASSFVTAVPAEEYEQMKAENARLKAEVEQLTAVIESHKDAGLRLLAMLDEERCLTKHLKAEVERLTKAGDAMALCFNCPTCAKSWHAAKEGKQS